MSTILQALQKNKVTQAGGPPPVIQPASESNLWKIVISLALFIIIALLSILIYLLINPSNTKLQNEVMSSEQVQAENNAIRISFETQPLPSPAPKVVPSSTKTVKTDPASETASVPKMQTDAQAVTTAETPQQTPQEAQSSQSDQEMIDYDEVPSGLKERFKLAVLLADIDQNNNSTDNTNNQQQPSDGSDIREMSRTFQDKVSPIRYDSHVYSTLAAERWIRINGEVLLEGEFDSTGELQLIEIQPQRSIFRVDRQSFSVGSLEDWKGY